MVSVDKIISLRYGSDELADLRDNAIHGNEDALQEYVYFCAWQGILRDSYIPRESKLRLFRSLVDSDMIEVKLNV